MSSKNDGRKTGYLYGEKETWPLNSHSGHQYDMDYRPKWKK